MHGRLGHGNDPAAANKQLVPKLVDALSGETAVAVAAVLSKRCIPGWVQVEMMGGVLEVEVDSDLEVRIRGPVADVGSFQVSEVWLNGFCR